MNYYDAHLGCEAVRLLPGEFFATDRDIAIVTVLGSCVAACLRDRKSGIGGMNHFMLPRERDETDPASVTARYGVHAMELLVNSLVRLGAKRAHLEAKVFGGGNVLSGVTALNVGHANALFVMQFLREESIPVVAEDLEGTVSRKVHFFPASGRALVRGIERARDQTILEREALYVERLRELPPGGSLELFT
ncbi:MAG TPA: chemoreceptor glutamine deamidase CheD [Usitatibacter sp.]|nr:chemoreceptor glutamine deamidase CheD [Usitatibacter sp.]